MFAGDAADKKQMEPVVTLGKVLDAPEPFIKRFTPAGGKINSVFDNLTIHRAKRVEIKLLSFPGIFHPFNEHEGWDY